MMNIEIKTKIISGNYDIIKIIHEFDYKIIGILCDASLYKNSARVRRIIEDLKDNFRIYLKLYDNSFEPSYQYLDRLMEEVLEKNLNKTLDVWIGVGGGSTMDTAKGLAILCKNNGPSIKYKGFPNDLNNPLPVIAIPSTTGSGSEVAFNASFIDEDTKTKMGIN